MEEELTTPAQQSMLARIRLIHTFTKIIITVRVQLIIYITINVHKGNLGIIRVKNDWEEEKDDEEKMEKKEEIYQEGESEHIYCLGFKMRMTN